MTGKNQAYYHSDSKSYRHLQKHFENYTLESMVIYNKDILYFTLLWEHGDKAGTVKFAKYDKNSKHQWQEIHISHYENHKLGIDFERNDVLASDSNDGYFNYISTDEVPEGDLMGERAHYGTHYLVHPIPEDVSKYQYPDTPKNIFEMPFRTWGALYKEFIFDCFFNIDKKLYALGGGSALVIKREQTGKWKSIGTKGLPTFTTKKNTQWIDKIYANSFDAFSDEDIYVCGSEGNLWHFNSGKWKQIDIPTLEDLVAVVCVIKGRVAVFEERGTVWFGEGNKWVRAYQLPTFEVYCATYFDNKLWVGGKLGSYIWDFDDHEQKEFKELKVMPYGFSFFHDNGDFLVLGDAHRVTVYDRKNQEFEPFVSW